MPSLPLRSFVLSAAAGLFATPLLCACFAGVAGAAPRVVCIGEQTTKTSEMSPTWPDKMQIDLGAAYTIANDGDNNGTVLAGSKGGTHTFATATNAPFKDSIMAPDIVVIGPWAEHDEIAKEGGADATHFQQDYEALVNAYLTLPKKPCIILTTPVLISTYQKNPATNMLVTNTIEPAVLAVAQAHGLKVVDLYTLFMNQAAWLGGDGHFTVAGAAQVATLVEAALPSCSSNGGGGAGAGGTSGVAGGAGASGASGVAGSSTGGSSAAGSSAGGAPAGSAGAPEASAGAPTVTGGASTSAAGAPATAGSTATPGGAGATGSAPGASDPAGCSCTITGQSSTSTRAWWLGALAAAWLARRNRKQRDHAN